MFCWHYKVLVSPARSDIESTRPKRRDVWHIGGSLMGGYGRHKSFLQHALRRILANRPNLELLNLRINKWID